MAEFQEQRTSDAIKNVNDQITFEIGHFLFPFKSVVNGIKFIRKVTFKMTLFGQTHEIFSVLLPCMKTKNVDKRNKDGKKERWKNSVDLNKVASPKAFHASVLNWILLFFIAIAIRELYVMRIVRIQTLSRKLFSWCALAHADISISILYIDKSSSVYLICMSLLLKICSCTS